MSAIYKRHYERMLKRLKSNKDKQFNSLRIQTVEPVFRSLQKYYGLWRMNVRDRNNANKVMLMAAAAFNLMKWMKRSIINVSQTVFNQILDITNSIIQLEMKLNKFEQLYTVSYQSDSQRYKWD